MNRFSLKQGMLLTLSMLSFLASFAQGDGPRSFLVLPKGIFAVNARWIGMDQNIDATGTILIPKAEVKLSLIHI